MFCFCFKMVYETFSYFMSLFVSFLLFFSFFFFFFWGGGGGGVRELFMVSISIFRGR